MARPPGAVRVVEADPRVLGVHAAISVPGAAGESLPEYVSRDSDAGDDFRHANHRSGCFRIMLQDARKGSLDLARWCILGVRGWLLPVEVCAAIACADIDVVGPRVHCEFHPAGDMERCAASCPGDGPRSNARSR